MTYVKDVFGRDVFKDLGKFYVGFDDQFDRLAKMHDSMVKSNTNYPPYNIKKVNDAEYVIELAVAGFDKTDLDIQVHEGTLTIKGSSKGEEGQFVFKGIGLRDFTKTFALNDQVEVVGAELSNGMLKVFLEKVVPDHKKPRQIPVNEKSAASRQLLTE